MFGDNVAPDLDLKCNLLVFLCAIGWKGGHLFPGKGELENPPEDGICKTFVAEDEPVTALKNLFGNLLKRQGKLTSHAGRKSACLWSRIRGGEIESIMTTADHSLFATAKKHTKGADAVAGIVRRVPDPKERLGTFQNCFCAAGTQSSERAMRPVAAHQCSLDKLVIGFIEQKVGTKENDPRSRSPKHPMEQILHWRKPNNAAGMLQQTLADIAQDKTADIMGCANSLMGEAQQKTQETCEQHEDERVKRRTEAALTEFQGCLATTCAEDDDVGEISTRMNELCKAFLATKGMSKATPTQTRKRDADDQGSSMANPKKGKKRTKEDCWARKMSCNETTRKTDFCHGKL